MSDQDEPVTAEEAFVDFDLFQPRARRAQVGVVRVGVVVSVLTAWLFLCAPRR